MSFQLLADPFALLAGSGLIILLVVAVLSIFWIWMLIDALSNTRLNGTEKIIWLLVIFFGHILGAVIYYFVGRGAKSGPSV